MDGLVAVAAERGAAGRAVEGARREAAAAREAGPVLGYPAGEGRHGKEVVVAPREVRRGDERQVADLGRTREIQRRFNVSVPRARVPEKAFTLRDRSER